MYENNDEPKIKWKIKIKIGKSSIICVLVFLLEIISYATIQLNDVFIKNHFPILISVLS